MLGFAYYDIDSTTAYYLVTSRLRYATVADVGPPSVCCLSRYHISKTKQDRPIVTMEYYQEVVVADSVAALRSSQDARGEIF